MPSATPRPIQWPQRKTPTNEVHRDGLTIVTPSFEKHYAQFAEMVRSLDRYCEDIATVRVIVIVEARNEAMFASLLSSLPRLSSRIILTEEILSGFGIMEKPGDFLKRIGKFTFQTLKKFGGLLAAETAWSLVLDSESIFHKPFRARQLLDDYRGQKYVFYTYTTPRGPLWRNSTGYQVTRNSAAALSVPAGGRWYMEYFHWFYETAKVRDLVENHLGRAFFADLGNPATGVTDYFENILYYLYLQNFHAEEYAFYDFKALLEEHLPTSLAARFELSELPFSLFGNEYLLNILSPEDISRLSSLFDRFKLPFVRLEPPMFDTRYLSELKKLPSFIATISSHHAIWLRKKIAVCVSGEFRHIVHRTPEQQVRHLVGFLSGVDCDIYVHGWSNSSEALILDELKPRGCLFEQKPSFARLAQRIKFTEPNIKPGRDEGSLAMFYGMEQAYKLMEANVAEYDFVLRIRPDIYSELSLKEILVKISDEGDFLQNAIYVPKQFHSKGINDQIALGPVAEMGVYSKTFSYIERNMEDLFFNPETVLLRRLLESKVKLALVDAPYTLLRELPFRINLIHEHFHRQFHTWWSRTEDLPLYEDLTEFFTDKLKAMDGIMRGLLPDLIYVRGPAGKDGAKRAVVRAKVIDNDPSRRVLGLFRSVWFWRIAPFIIRNGVIEETADHAGKQVFVFPEGDEMIVSEWRMEAGRLVNGRFAAMGKDVNPAAAPLGIRMKVSFFMEQLRGRRPNGGRGR